MKTSDSNENEIELIYSIIKRRLESSHPECSSVAGARNFRVTRINPEWVGTITPEPKKVLQVDSYLNEFPAVIVAIF